MYEKEGYSKLYLKDKYLDDSIDYLFNHEIIEYDLESGGFNICKEFKLLDKKTIDMLEMCDKKRRHIELGLISKNDKEFAKKLSEGFKKARELFFKANNIEDYDVLSIKKDAIFLLKRVSCNNFGSLNFRIKNIYSSYLKLNQIEILYNKNKIDVKGIDDNILRRHEGAMLAFLELFIKEMETETNKNKVAKFLKDFATEYKTHDLPIDFYREFNANSLYRCNIESSTGLTYYLEENSNYDIIDTSYNYMYIITPLIATLIN